MIYREPISLQEYLAAEQPGMDAALADGTFQRLLSRPIDFNARKYGSYARRELENGIETAAFFPSRDLSHRFVERCFLMARSGLSRTYPFAHIGDPEKTEEKYEKYLAYKSLAYSEAILAGKPLAEEPMRKSAESILLFAGCHRWDVTTAGEVLIAAMGLLMAGEFDRVLQLLAKRSRFRWLQVWRDGLHELALGLKADPGSRAVPAAFEKLHHDVMTLHDSEWIRDASIDTSTLFRFEIRALRLMVTEPMSPLFWGRAMDIYEGHLRRTA